MDLIQTLANSIGNQLQKPFALTAQEQQFVNNGIAGAIGVGVVISEKLIAKKFPGAGTVIRDVLAAFSGQPMTNNQPVNTAPAPQA